MLELKVELFPVEELQDRNERGIVTLTSIIHTFLGQCLEPFYTSIISSEIILTEYPLPECTHYCIMKEDLSHISPTKHVDTLFHPL